jgi:membrane associated rhomboid family serine protease
MYSRPEDTAPRHVIWDLLENTWLPAGFVAVLWAVFLWSNAKDIRLVEWGVLPRTREGLAGIITSVFIHGDFSHISSNSAPILILGTLLYYFYRKLAVPVFLWIWLISGTWLWIGGGNSTLHPTWHIGASTLIYGLATFLFFSGVFRKHRPLMVISALVVFLYGSMMWGVFPLMPGMSWEGHLFGAIAGLLVAYNYRNEGPQKPEFEWNDEEEEELPWMGDNENPPASTFNITYHFKPSSKANDSKDLKA